MSEDNGQVPQAHAYDILKVLKALPHRYPLLLVDRVAPLTIGEEIHAIKAVSFNEQFFQGHFPGRPIMPGVLQLEAIAQVAPDRALNVTEALTLLPAEDHAHEGETSHEGEEPHADEHSTLDGDPHVWLNPLNMATIGDEIAARLTALDSGGAFAAGAQALTESMNTLNEEWAQGTAECRSRDLVVSHEAFGYLAAQYDFAQIGIAGLSPDAEPSPARIACFHSPRRPRKAVSGRSISWWK